MHLEQFTGNEKSMQIVNQIAEIEGTSADKLPPLFDVLDPESLDALLKSDGVTVSFTYLDYAVTISHDGVLSITDGSKPGDRA